MGLKKTEDYMILKYAVELETIDPELGGGYIASIPELGKKAFRGYGETADEALTELENVKWHLFSKYLSNGIPVPLPEVSEEKVFSGKLLVRMPRDLHRSLAGLAKNNSTTLNSYIVY